MALLIRLYCLALLLAWPVTAVAESVQLYEQEIKAGLLYNFLKYTDWPAHALSGPSIVVCIFGDDPFKGNLNSMTGRSVNERTIAVRYVNSISATAACNLLFVNADEQNSWPQLQAFLGQKSVLTVSDFPGFAASGGMIEFGHKEDHIDAVINLDAVTASHLRVEGRLLKLVTVLNPAGKPMP